METTVGRWAPPGRQELVLTASGGCPWPGSFSPETSLATPWLAWGAESPMVVTHVEIRPW